MISEQTLIQIADRVTAAGVDESTLAALRGDYPELHFTWCSDDDITNIEPVLEREQFNLFLVDGREHCLCLTRDFENATGVVVAEIYSD